MGAELYPVILCGGSGTRLWPASRKSFPKQFCPLLEGGSLFQRTLERLEGAGYADPVLLTNQEFRFVVAEQLSDMGGSASRILLEPEGRNTAPAVCLAALEAFAWSPEATLLVLPSDHLIADREAFHRAVAEGRAAADQGRLVTFGVPPDRPETGYGYLELEGRPAPGAQPFLRFVEKPDAPRAEEMLATGRYLWNSGMFLFRADAILSAFDVHAPEIRAACADALAGGREDLCFFRPDPQAYARSSDISIDYAIMERVQGSVVPLTGGWNDLGSWRTVWAESAPDGDGVATNAGALAIDCRDTLLRADGPDQRLVGIGLSGIVAVATGDAVLVADMDRGQEVRTAVERLRAEGAAQATEFSRCYRPWGWYESLAKGERFQVKQIMVKPEAKLSLQSHHHRAEHWVVVAGTARVTVGEEVRLLTENESVYIPLGAVHRLENPGKLDLHLIEVQSGSYLGEDDIVRYEDIYARD
ncbi:MAG: mannose-1-phosphate guanylyltransferase/mannose-6-phosphate isomerase [Pseudomonadota bacterium]